MAQEKNRIAVLDFLRGIASLGVVFFHFFNVLNPGFLTSISYYGQLGPQVFLHFAYINVFFGYPWLSDVFWTLAIEFQYDLLIGLVFPLVFSRRLSIRLATFVALGTLSFVIHPPAYIFYYMFLFFMGIWTCQFKLGLIG